MINCAGLAPALRFHTSNGPGKGGVARERGRGQGVVYKEEASAKSPSTRAKSCEHKKPKNFNNKKSQ